jgi:hypothetical protein
VLRKGQSGFAALGVNAQETQASSDAALTFGILWLEVCREAQASKVVIEGLKLFVPQGSSALVRERMANLNRQAAKWRLFELDERDDALVEVDCADRGNVATRLVHAPDESAAQGRFAESIAKIRGLLPNCEVAVLSAAEIAFPRWRGLEFARARLAAEERSFRTVEEIVFGVGRRSESWKSTMNPYSRTWSRLYAIFDILTGRGSILCGGCVRSAGWSRWWWAT